MENTLIIKMFDGKLGYMGLMKRLKKVWQLKGELTLTDIGCKFFIVRFTSLDDYNFVLTQGPWLIDDSYLTIRKWISNFIPDEEPIMILTTWVRIPNLSVEYFDRDFLMKVGSKIGKVLRVDKNTAYAAFTRIVVEIDLSKPLLSKFWLKGKIWRIQYEWLRMVCFRCGKLGHAEENCQPEQPKKAMVIDQINAKPKDYSINEENNHKPEENEDFGSWMLVKKLIRKRPVRHEKQHQINSKGGQNYTKAGNTLGVKNSNQNYGGKENT